MGREGILLVGFGSTHPQSIKAYKALQEAAQTRFAPMLVRMAYTSEHIRARRLDAKSDSVGKALARMRFERFTHVYIQTLQLISGHEYHDVAEEAAKAIAPSFSTSLGLPLLPAPPFADTLAYPFVSALSQLAPTSSQCLSFPAPSLALQLLPFSQVASALCAILPACAPDEAIVCVAHGSAHPAESAYHILADQIRQTHPNFFITGMKTPREPLYAILSSYKRICLVPLFAVLGKHALEDMAGTTPSSWLSTLQAQGFACRTFLHGLVEFPCFIDIWLERLGELIGRE